MTTKIIGTTETLYRYIIQDPEDKTYFSFLRDRQWTKYINSAHQFLTRDQAQEVIDNILYGTGRIHRLIASYHIEYSSADEKDTWYGEVTNSQGRKVKVTVPR